VPSSPKLTEDVAARLPGKAPSGTANQASLFPELQSQSTNEVATGMLASQHIGDLLAGNRIVASQPLDDDQIQPASLDLRLGHVAYEVRGSFLPGRRRTVASRAKDLLVEALDLSDGAVLRRGRVYIVPLLEEVRLPSDYSAKANPKSTTGRLDVFTRLITDGGTEFEYVPAGYRGPLHVEVAPRTFDVRVRTGTRLNQLRIRRGDRPSRDTDLVRLNSESYITFSPDGEQVDPEIEGGLRLGVDLAARDDTRIVGYRAKSHTPIIDLEKVGHYDPAEFWEPISAPQSGFIVLDPSDFYILVSKQRLRVPINYAADMVAYDPAAGEFRVHYAGFFDPGFGSADPTGAPAVLEVRSHDVPFVLEDGQAVARLIYERLLDTATKVYGQQIGSSYQGQALNLSKQFRARG
jgi:dCTP deaminase